MSDALREALTKYQHAPPGAQCWGCESWANDACSAAYVSGCRECDARGLAQSPLFHTSAPYPEPADWSKTYRTALRYVFGGEWRQGHERVKEWSKRIGDVKQPANRRR